MSTTTTPPRNGSKLFPADPAREQREARYSDIVTRLGRLEAFHREQQQRLDDVDVALDDLRQQQDRLRERLDDIEAARDRELLGGYDPSEAERRNLTAILDAHHADIEGLQDKTDDQAAHTAGELQELRQSIDTIELVLTDVEVAVDILRHGPRPPEPPRPAPKPDTHTQAGLGLDEPAAKPEPRAGPPA